MLTYKKAKCAFSGVDPSIAQLVERWTVEVMEIHRSLVRIRLEGLFFFFCFVTFFFLSALEHL